MENCRRNFSIHRVSVLSLVIITSQYIKTTSIILIILNSSIYSDIVIAAVDSTVATVVAGKNDIKGYPTIKFFPKGSTKGEDYNGGRTAPDIVK